MRVMFISRDHDDLWKQEFFRDRLREAYPEVETQIICAESNPQHQLSKPDVVYIMDGFAAFAAQHTASPAQTLIALQAAQFRFVPANLFRADERFLAGTLGERPLALEQIYLTQTAVKQIEAFQPDMMFMTGGGTLVRNVFFLVGQRLGVRCYRILNVWFANPGREGVRYWFSANNDYARSSSPADKFTYSDDAVGAHVEKLVESVRSQHYRLDQYAHTVARKVRSSLDVKSVLRDVRRHIHVRRLRLAYDAKARRRLRSWKNHLLNRCLSSQPQDIDEPFFLFPLNVPDDAQLVLRAPHYKDLLSLCEQIANVLPFGHVLVIKEHPGHPGMIDHARLKSLLQRQDRLRFVNADVPMPALLPRASALVVINSTSGFEALANDIPVVTLSEVFYKHPDLTYDVEYPLRLAWVLSETLADPKKPARQQKLREVLADFIQETVPAPGEIALPADNNQLKVIARGIVARVGTIC